MNDGSFCAEASAACGEELAGTAIAGCRFLVCLSFARAWPRKILDGPQLPDATVALLASLDRMGHVRVQYLRHSEAVDSEHVELIVADTERGRMRRWKLSDYRALEGIDWTSLTRYELPEGGDEASEPAILVCTHGKRDRCCAKWGGAFWRELLAQHDHPSVQLWQTSHLGGHRFAPTALVLPWGFQYGRLSAEDAIGLLDAVAAGDMYRIDLLRGRVAWTAPAQVAEIAARRQSGGRRYGAVTPTEVVSVTDDSGRAAWDVTVSVGDTSNVWRVVAHKDLEHRRPPSCGKSPEPPTSWSVCQQRS